MRDAGVDTEKVLHDGLVSFMEGAMLHGVFHGDLHGGNLFVHALEAALETGAHRLVILLPATHANRHRHTTVGQHVHGGNFLGHPHRIVHWQHVEGGIDLHPLGGSNGCRQQHSHIEGGAGNALPAGQAVERALVHRPEPFQVVIAA